MNKLKHNAVLAAGLLVLSGLTAPLSGQVASCWDCDAMMYPDGYYYASCSMVFDGAESCSQDIAGGEDYDGGATSACNLTGGSCTTQAMIGPDGSISRALLAVAAPGYDLVPTSDGMPTVRTRGGHIARTCDGALIRRHYSAEQVVALRGQTATIAL